MADEKEKDPAVLLYTSNFLSGTSHLKDDELGFYTRLLAHQQQKFSLSMDFIKRTCKGNFEKKWNAIKDKFRTDADGFYYNVRMRKEIEKRNKLSLSQSAKAYKKWEQDQCRGISPGTSRGIDSADAFLENENVNEDQKVLKKGKEGAGEKEKWEHKPTDLTMQLTDLEFDLTAEFIFRLKQKLLKHEQINEFWNGFKIQYFNGEQTYNTRTRCIQHFRDWLKFQKEDGQKITGTGGRQKRLDDLNALE